MNIDSIIPARGGSKGVPKKNIKKLNGHPLIAYSIATSKLSKYIRHTIVSTDCEYIAKIAENYGARILYLRPEEISRDDSIDLDFFKYHIKFLDDNNLSPSDLLVQLRPTTPLREMKVVNKAIENFKTNIDASALRSAYLTHLTPYKMFKKEGDYMRPFLKSDLAKEFYNLPRQVFEDAYIPNGYIDIIRTNVIQRTDTLHGDNILLYETDDVADIDTIEDFSFAERIVDQERFNDITKYLNKVSRV